MSNLREMMSEFAKSDPVARVTPEFIKLDREISFSLSEIDNLKIEVDRLTGLCRIEQREVARLLFERPANTKLCFNISGDEHTKVLKWDEEHLKSCIFKDGVDAIGGRLTYSFTGTGLGTIIKVTCACATELDLTDYDAW